MPISYASGAPVQSNPSFTNNTTSGPSTTIVLGAYNVTQLPFVGQSGLVAGQIITSPTAAAGAVILQASATSVQLDRILAISVPGGATVTAQDADGVFGAGGTGVTVTTTGATLGDQSRSIAFTAAAPLVQFTINGTFNTLAQKNTYLIAATANSAAGVTVAGGATWNVLSTTNNLPTGQPIPSGSICLTTTNRTANPETINGAILVLGTLNISGAGFWCNNNFSLDTSDRTSAGTGCTVNLNNATFRLGTATGGALNAIYTDYYRGTGTNQLFTFNITNSNIIDTYFKFLAVKPSSVFTGVRWFKTIPQTSTQATNLDIAIAITPLSTGVGYNFNGPTFRLNGDAATEYNTHIATGITSSNGTGRQSAIRNTVYGYEIGLLPKIGKVIDFPAYRCWFEGRKNLSLSVLNADGTNAASAGTYLEDYVLHTGQLATANIIAASGQNAGFADGAYVSTTGSIPGNGSNGQITITVTGGRVVNAVITNAGSGYSASNGTGLVLPVNNANFSGAGNGTQPCNIVIWPFQRYGAYTSVTANGCPDFTGNRIYIADVASGILSTTQTNSGNSGVTLNTGNPVVPNGSAYTGLDLLLWSANAGYTDLPSTWGSAQGLAPIDNRWSANGSTTYSVTIPVRGYGYLDVNYVLTEAKGLGAVAQVTDTLFLAADTYINATGISEATASTYSDITLSTAAPTRNATTGALIQTSTGTLNTTIARTLDQVGAKTKYDYTRRVLNATAGIVVRTGFGIGSFISNSGTLTSATLSIGSWGAVLTGKQTQGTVYKTLSCTGNVTLSGQATAASDNGINLIANNIILGDPGTPASFTINTGVTGILGSGTITLSGLGALVPGGSVTVFYTASSASRAADNTGSATAIQAALPFGSSVVAAIAPDTLPQITWTYAAGITAASAGTATVNFTGTNLSNLPASITTSAIVASSNENVVGLAMRTALANDATISPWWVITGTGPSVTMTARPIGATNKWTTITVTTSFANTPTSGLTTTPVATGFTQGAATHAYIIPAVASAVTPVPNLSSTIANFFSNPSYGTVTSSTAIGAVGTTVYQQLTASTRFQNLPRSGVFLATGGALLGGTLSIMMTGSLLATGGACTANQTYSPTNNTQTLSFTGVTLANSITIATPDSNNYQVTLNNCSLSGDLSIMRTGTGTFTVLVSNQAYNGYTITYGPGVTAVALQVITLLGTSALINYTDIKVARLWVGGIERTGTPSSLFTFTRDSSNNVIATVTGGLQLASSTFYVVFFIDGYDPVGTGSQTIGSVVNLSANGILPANLDFTTPLAAVDTDVITRGSVTYTPAVVSPYVPPIVTINTPNNAFLTAGNSNLYSTASIGISKLVVRRITELLSNTAYHQAMALLTIPGAHLTWTTVGYTVNNGVVNGTETIRVILQKNSSNSASVVVMDLFIDNSAYLKFPNQDTYLYATLSTNIIQAVVLLIKSPGAVLQLTSADQSAVATYAVSGIVGNNASPGPLAKVARGVEAASLQIPATISVP